MKANCDQSVSHKKGSKKLSHDVVRLGNLLHMAAAKKGRVGYECGMQHLLACP